MKNKQDKENKNSNVILYFIIGVLVVIAIVGPFIINSWYIKGGGFTTVWGGSEVLAYLGSLISGFGSIILGVVAIRQNNKLNDINERILNNNTELINIQVNENTPKLELGIENAEVMISEEALCFSLYIANRNKNIIEILDELQINVNFSTLDMYSAHEEEINYNLNMDTRCYGVDVNQLSHNDKKVYICSSYSSDVKKLYENMKEILKFRIREKNISRKLIEVDAKIKIRNLNSTDCYIQECDLLLCIEFDQDIKEVAYLKTEVDSEKITMKISHN